MSGRPRIGLTTLGLLLIASASHAATIQLIDTYTPTASPVTLSNGVGFEYFHDITPPLSSNNDLQAFIDATLTAGEGYDSSTDSLSSGTLTLFFNVSGAGASTKSYTLFLADDVTNFGGDLVNGTPRTIEIGSADFEVSWITTAGQLAVEVTRTSSNGNVAFVKSVLDVSGTRRVDEYGDENGPAPVPEPASLFLLGSGLVGAAAAARRKIRHQRPK